MGLDGTYQVTCQKGQQEKQEHYPKGQLVEVVSIYNLQPKITKDQKVPKLIQE